MALVKQEWVGRELARVEARVDRPRLRAFARAIGLGDPVYHEVEAARAAGYRDLPAPPTFLFCLEMLDAPNPFHFVQDLGIDIGKILHGEQQLTYVVPVCAGDRLLFRARVSEVYEKKGGVLGFVAQDSEVTNERAEVVARLRRVLVVRAA